MDPVTSIFRFFLGPAQDFISRASGYIISCKTNIDSLTREMSDLKSKREYVENKIENAEREGKKPTSPVELWLKRVKDLEGEATKMEADFQKRFRCLGDFSPNVWSDYQLSRRAEKMIEEAKDLKNTNFTEIASESGPDRFSERPGGSVMGMGSVLKQLQDYVRDENVSIIGIYGMGGVGKTNLLEKLNNEFLPRDIDNVIWIDMSDRPNVEEFQKAVGEILGLSWQENKEQKDRAHNIFKYLHKKNFVLILDNIWEPLDLKKVGIPTPKCQSKSKIILTTRIEDVCDRMDAKKVRVNCLGWKEAWSLFVEKTGEELIDSHPKIRRHAEVLAKKCGGLPLALITVGHAMASKRTPAQWKHAITALNIAPWQILGMGENVFSCLKQSYDNLADDKLRTCLLYCSLYPEEFSIYKEWIIDYCIGEGIIDDLFNDMEEIYNKGHDLLGVIKAASLLESGDDEDHIKMHPMIRALALWIACECGTNENKWLVRASNGLKEAPEVEKWWGAERISLMRNNINVLSERPNCPSLLTLMLQRNRDLEKISDGFFQFMPILRVLDLSHTSIKELPAGIEALVGLQYLDLCGTKIRSLPKELGAMIRLRFLLLSYTPYLKTIPDGVIAKLSELQVFYIHFSYGDWKVGSIGDGVDLEELNCLKRLKALGITIGTVFALLKLARSYRLAKSTRNLHIRGCPGLTTISSATLGSDHKALQWLRVSDSSDLKEIVISGGGGGDDENDDDDNEQSTLPNLHTLVLQRLRKAKLAWEGGCLRNLSTLIIFYCNGIEQLIHCDDEVIGGGEEEEEEEFEAINALPNLKTIHLLGLPKFKSLSGGRRALAFPSLEIIEVKECPKLKKLALIADNLREIRGRKSWWNGVEWEDDNIKLKFLPFFKELQ